jgi:hypothetical protein
MVMLTRMTTRASCAIIRKSLANAANEKLIGYAADMYCACWEALAMRPPVPETLSRSGT